MAAAREGLEAQVAARTAELAEANARLEAEVAERCRAEQAALDGESRLGILAQSLRLAVEATDLGIWDVEPVTGSCHWSDEQKAILGLAPDRQADHALFASLIHPDDRNWVIERYRRAYAPASGGRYRAQFRIRRADDGAERWVEATGRVHFDELGRPIRGVGTLADVTERRRAVEALKESEERYRALVETGPDAVLAHVEGIIILANRQAAELFGVDDAAALIGRAIFDLVAEESIGLAQERTAALRSPGDRLEPAQLTYRRLDGSPFVVEAAAAAVAIDGRLAMQVVFRDVTERRRTEIALQARTAELETMMETVPVAVWLAHDREARRITGNRHGATQLRLAPSDNLSLAAPPAERPRHFRVYRDGLEVPPERLPLQRAARGEVVRNDELRIRFDDGTFYDELTSASPVRDAAGVIVGAVGAAMDITERKAAEEQVRHLALHDPLTGLPNRMLFQDRLASALARARRSGGQVAVMLLDLDHFKDVNDSLGHTVGDALLREVASRLATVARASDTWARLGGDEFALVQEGPHGAEGVATMASRVLAVLDRPFRLDGHELDVACSLGVTIYPTDGDTPEMLVRNADVALYRAKSAGRGRFEPYRDDLDRELRRDRRLQRELRRALDADGFELAYQPIFALPRQRLVKVEALVRWRLADGSSVPPATFIPLAERSGLIHPLGEWVLAAACRQALAWSAAGRPLRIAVNVSASQLRHGGFVAMVRRALDDTGLDPGLLELELTESVFVDGAKDQIQETLRQISAVGVALTIDDFGTGHSSLAYLRHFPFDEVKIDGSFVADIGRDPTGGAIAAAVIGLAHSLGKRVTAEGVETVEQLDFLRERGCDAAQGYLLAGRVPQLVSSTSARRSPEAQRLSPRTARQTASVICRVVAPPPRSGVWQAGSAVARSIARISRSAACGSPRCSSIKAPDQSVPIGLAMPRPAMSKAEPWIGSNIEGAARSGFRFAVGAIPSEPASAAARSERMSACRLVATIVSSVDGRSVMRMVIASTSILSQPTSGNSRATSAAISSHITMPKRCAFDLVTTVRPLRGRERASAKAKRMMRVTLARVNSATSVAVSCGRPRCERPPWPAYSPSEFSRTITQSRSAGVTSLSGLVIPGRRRIGRTLAYWSRPWQIASRNPHRLTWSGTSGDPTAPNRIASNARNLS